MAPASLHQTSKRVCVMDASGRLGSSLVERLLQRGYMVNAAVCTHGNLQPLKGLNCDTNKNLRIFESDPFDYQSIINALKGCSALFYTFEPPEEQPTFDEFMAEVEVRAAHNVLEACAQTDTIEKVIFTSSITAVIWREDRQSINDLDEKNWSDVNFCRKFKLWHALSKTLAEKTAWALAMDRGVQMVSINAGLLVGPEVSIKTSYLKGAAEMYEDGVLATVDLRLLVDAHICVFEDISSYGRYLCFNHVINRPEDAVKFAQMLTPSVPSSPQSCEDLRIFQQRISNKKLNKVMVDYKELMM
ncbi:3-beta hydroxysteroid dehydrogenase/isomerase [Macleaya cordata]|uniref:3-beta hydroxysteroid dehydrogenase/isomerase n=1 Tax=Macleaya cordata TaxID=56857 RepID=A0A200PXF6_MACCD|nr:3-beta hydroxysteroid dehydrogenase/isomerase [Macleaya cordata]